MKSPHFLLPLSALAVSVIYLSYQHQSLAALETQTDVLRKTIAATEAGGATSRNRPSAGQPAAAPPKPLPAIDQELWKRLATQGNAAWDPEIVRLFSSMSAAELISRLEEIKKLDLPENRKMSLEGLVARFLADKDPAAVFQQLASHLTQESLKTTFGEAYQKWMTQDGSGATRWLDAQIAAGVFDAKTLREDHPTHSLLERVTLESLIDSNTKAAANRLVNLPASQQKTILVDLVQKTKPSSDRALAEIVRSGIPEGERDAMFGPLTGQLDQKGLDRVSEFLKHIDPTPAERSVITGTAIVDKLSWPEEGKSLEEQADALRTWANGEGSAVTDHATGEALGSRMRYLPYDEIAALVTKYQGPDR